MSARVRVWALAALAAVAVVALTVGVPLATRTNVRHERVAPPPFLADPTAPRDVAAGVRDALRAWPSGTIRRLRILAAEHPRSALVRLELGIALADRGETTAAQRALREAARVQPDSPSAVRAEDALHPDEPRGNPPFIPTFTRPRTQVEQLLARGVAYQVALRPVSAERAFAAAARVAPNDPEALTAAAVGLFDKDRPALAFSRLGPLVRRFPRAQTVRFHLGVMLIFIRQFRTARRELQLAVAEGPGTLLAKRARALLRASKA